MQVSLDEGTRLADLAPDRFFARLTGAGVGERSVFAERLVQRHAHLALGQMLHVLLRVAQHRDRVGVFPGELRELRPAGPHDPHSGVPFAYEVRDGVCHLGPPAIAVLLGRDEDLVGVLE